MDVRRGIGWLGNPRRSADTVCPPPHAAAASACDDYEQWSDEPPHHQICAAVPVMEPVGEIPNCQHERAVETQIYFKVFLNVSLSDAQQLFVFGTDGQNDDDTQPHEPVEDGPYRITCGTVVVENRCWKIHTDHDGDQEQVSTRKF